MKVSKNIQPSLINYMAIKLATSNLYFVPQSTYSSEPLLFQQFVEPDHPNRIRLLL